MRYDMCGASAKGAVAIAAVLVLLAGGCASDEPSDAAHSAEPPSDVGSIAPADAQSGDADTEPTTEDVTAEDAEDTAVDAPEPDAGPQPEDVASPDDTTDIQEPVEPPPGLVVDAAWLEGPLLYGISSDPESPLSQIGQSAAGIAPVLVAVVLTDDRAEIRVADASGAPGKGDDALVESYPYALLPDEKVALDLREPTDAVSIQLYQSCTYELTGVFPAGDPVVADGLLTWPLLESYASSGCEWGGLPASISVNVHYLRQLDASDYEPRAADEDAPFGFFLVPSPKAPKKSLLTRMPMDSDGSLVYYTLPGFPEELLSTVGVVLESWNDVLAEATGVRPFAHALATDDMIAWDPRYRTIVWDGTKTVGAIAPFTADPLTGEMFSTRVLLWIGDLQSMVEKYTAFLDEHPDAPWVGYSPDADAMRPPPGWNDDRDLPRRVLRRQAYAMRPFGLDQVRELYDATARSLPPDEMARHILAQFLVHELGHNLGLRHNFKGSADRAMHDEAAPSTTVMDYVIGIARPGTYDRDAILYAYGDGAEQAGYHACSDEGTDVDPACTQWDRGDPLAFALLSLDALADSIEADASAQQLEGKASQEEWNKLFRRSRQFVGTEWETWEPELPTSTFTELLGRVACGPECATHPWLRTQLALYLLYTRYAVQAWWEPGAPNLWYDFPALDETQSALLMEALFTLVTTPGEPVALKDAIIDKLPTAKVDGALDLLLQLRDHFEAKDEPTPEDTKLLQGIKAALAGA